MEIVDAWMQHPTPRHSNHPMFESLRRWAGRDPRLEPLPVRSTLSSMDAAGVGTGLSAAWYGPQDVLISNEEVAGFVAESGGRLRGEVGGQAV